MSMTQAMLMSKAVKVNSDHGYLASKSKSLSYYCMVKWYSKKSHRFICQVSVTQVETRRLLQILFLSANQFCLARISSGVRSTVNPVISFVPELLIYRRDKQSATSILVDPKAVYYSQRSIYIREQTLFTATGGGGMLEFSDSGTLKFCPPPSTAARLKLASEFFGKMELPIDFFFIFFLGGGGGFNFFSLQDLKYWVY